MDKINQYRWHGFWIFCIAILTRCLYFFQYQENPYFDHYNEYADTVHFDVGAQSFANGDWLANSPLNHHAPLYKYLLGTFYMFAGRNLPAVWCVQFFIGALTVLLIFLICRHQFNIRTAWIAGLLYNFHGLVLMYEGLILRASLLSFLAVLSLYVLLTLPREPSVFRLIAAGLAIAVFIQCRPNVLAVFVFILFFYKRKYFGKGFLEGSSVKLAFTSKEVRNRLIKKIFLWPASLYENISKIQKTLILIVILFCLPSLIQAYIVHGKFVLFSSQGPGAILNGNHPDHLGMGYDPTVRFHGIEQIGFVDTVSLLISRYVENPLEMALLYSRKIYFFFCSFQVPNNYDYKLFQEFSFLLRTPLSNFGLMSSLGLFGFCLGMRNFRRHRMLYAYSFGMAAGVIIIVIKARYRLPVVPFFAIWAGFALDRLASWHECKQYVKSASSTVSIAALFTFLNSPDLIPDYKLKGHINYDFRIGVNYFRGERYQEALERLLNSKKEFPDNEEILRFTSASYIKLNQVKRAQEELENLIALYPDNAWALKLLGGIYLNEGNYSGAAKHLKAYTLRKPDDSDAVQKLGRAQILLGDYKSGSQTLQGSLDKMNSASTKLWLEGSSLFQSGNYSESRSKLKEFMEKKPEHIAAMKLYALTYCNQNQIRECIIELEKYLAMSSKDASMHYFIASIYAKSNHIELAAQHAKKSYEQSSPDSSWKRRSKILLEKLRQ